MYGWRDDSVEEVLLAVGEQVGHDQLSYAVRMNKVVVVKTEPLVSHLFVECPWLSVLYGFTKVVSGSWERLFICLYLVPNTVLGKQLYTCYK